MIKVSNLFRYLVSSLVVILIAAPASATYHAQNSLTNLLSQTFLPAGVQLVGPQGVIYGILLPFVIVFTLIYVGMRKIDILGRRETQVMALAISLFLIPSGGYRIISQLLLTLFGLGATGFGVPGLNVSIQQISFLQGLGQLQRCTVMAGIVGAVTALILNAGPAPKSNDGDGDGGSGRMDMSAMFGKAGIGVGEWFIILTFMAITWLTTCGFAPLITAIGWLIAFFVGVKLLTAYYKVGGGGIPALLSLVGLLVIAMLIRSQSMFPQELRTIGDWILGGVIGIVLLIVVVVVILAYMAWVWAD